MHAKIISPQAHGKVAYQNTGSVARTLNYLAQESKGEGKEAAFFGAATDQISFEELREKLDTNVKGLRESDVKFYSLVLSPSEAELKQIGNDEGKLRDYTRAVMEQYAANFKLPNGRELSSSDLVWGATIHQHRSYRGDDAQVAAGEKKAGERKEGLQAHVHVTVSARDREQKITLNPQGQKRRFDMVSWQGQAQATFEAKFGKGQEQGQGQEKRAGRVKREPTPEQVQTREDKQEKRVRGRVDYINSQLGERSRLDPERVVEIARQRAYSKEFTHNLGFVGKRAEEGRPIENPHRYLETGRLEKSLTSNQQLRVVAQVMQATAGQTPQRSHVQEIGEERERRGGRGY